MHHILKCANRMMKQSWHYPNMISLVNRQYNSCVWTLKPNLCSRLKIQSAYRELSRENERGGGREKENTLGRGKYCNSFDQWFLSWIHVSCCECIMNSSETRANKAIGIPQTRWQCISLSQLFWRKRWWSITYHRLFVCLFIRGYSFLCYIVFVHGDRDKMMKI